MLIAKLFGSAIGLIIGLAFVSLIYFLIALPIGAAFMLLVPMIPLTTLSIGYWDSVMIWWTIIALTSVINAWMSEK